MPWGVLASAEVLFQFLRIWCGKKKNKAEQRDWGWDQVLWKIVDPFLVVPVKYFKGTLHQCWHVCCGTVPGNFHNYSRKIFMPSCIQNIIFCCHFTILRSNIRKAFQSRLYEEYHRFGELLLLLLSLLQLNARENAQWFQRDSSDDELDSGRDSVILFVLLNHISQLNSPIRVP